MNLPGLYRLFESRSRADLVIELPSWIDIAKAAEVDACDDTLAFRALVEKGAIERRCLGAAAFGDYEYLIRRPASADREAFMVCLGTVGASVWHLVSDRG